MSYQSRKISEKINEKLEKDEIFFSFEYFPPKTDRGVQNLYMRIDLMAQFKPLFVDVTWGAGGGTSDLTPQLCMDAYRFCGLEPNMHITCTNMEKAKIDKALKDLKDAGLRNVFALRGDPPRGEAWKQCEGGFAHAVDLVKYIRKEYGDWFCIGVAGYPEKHVDCETYEKDLQYLKEKVDAGADFIITQLFYSAAIFIKFVNDCRAIGITVPILPGLMPIMSYQGLNRMCTLCGTHIPPKILQDLESVKDDDEAVQAYGVKQCAEMCKELIDAGIKGLHFYTLNMEKSVRSILMSLSLINESHLTKELPWSGARAVKNGKLKESVRPIFWANRPKSFIDRTRDWDAYPNGRWGDAESPAFQTLDLYHTHRIYCNSVETRKIEWGEPKSEQDVYNVFVSYLQGKTMRLPWNDSSLASESTVISEMLLRLNHNGFLTINSQPRVNGAPSDDKVHGWGGPGGFVYQKAYVEFFTNPEKLQKLLQLFPKHPSLSYQAVNMAGDSHGNLTSTSAVTWGVFPSSEIKQPTVVDPDTFINVWKDEAFALWQSQWSSLYPDDHQSHQLINKIANSYYLVNIVENNFIDGNILTIFEEILEDVKS